LAVTRRKEWLDGLKKYPRNQRWDVGWGYDFNTGKVKKFRINII